MTAMAILPVRIRKEVRGLTPAWLAALALMIVTGFGDRLRGAGVIGYLIGAVALGALSMGHEYNGRTMTLLLSQPSSRERLFFRKFGVLVAMLATLAAVAWVGLLSPTAMAGSFPDYAARWRMLAFGLPLLCGLFLAPWLTMVCRNALAGIIFAIAVPGGLWIASEWTSTFVYGAELSTLTEAGNLTLDVFWRLMLCASTVGAISTWAMFMRLEAIDSRGIDLHLPSWLFPRGATDDPGAARRQAPSWLLLCKELRLQQLTFAVSGLYLAGWFGLAFFGQFLPQPQYRSLMLAALTVLHAGAVPLLAGSLASAEERNMGTLSWQVLLPIPAWKQWVLKTAVVITVSLGLALGLPAAISSLTPSVQMRADLPPLLSMASMMVVIGTAVVSLYVSTLSGNGLRALLISLPVAVGMIGIGGSLTRNQIYGNFGLSLVFRPSRFGELFGTPEWVLWGILSALIVATFVGAMALLLRFGMHNHRSAERGAARVWTQLVWMAGTVVVCWVAGYGLFSVYADRVNGLFQERTRQAEATIARATFVVEGSPSVRANVVVIVFDALPAPSGSFAKTYRVLVPDPRGEINFFRMNQREGLLATAVARPGTSAAVLWKELDSTPHLRDPLRQAAIPFAMLPGETTTVTVPLTMLP